LCHAHSLCDKGETRLAIVNPESTASDRANGEGEGAPLPLQAEVGHAKDRRRDANAPNGQVLGMIAALRWLLKVLAKPEPVQLTEASGDPAAYELAYREARRALDLQVASLDGLRSRAGLVLSAAALIAGFLGPTAILQTTVRWLLIVGGGCFVGAALLSIGLLLGVGNWRAVVGTRELLANYIESNHPASVPEIHRSLAWQMEDDWERNERRLRILNRLLGVAGALVGAETIVWLVAIAA
jgi:hypothetical protein